ncbi:hypothetical protein MNBD_GAMMA11-360 [hydrothermal vent metagenome]|uniref:Immunity MXAN-0049 protein domain-containing protein n=1 Tax=hydrothermal vent metagenome TaxID=652676 RepID=A0A3B0WYN3_9ZZZZ
MIVYALHPDSANKKIFVMPDEYKLQKISDFDTGKKKEDNWNPPGISWFNDDGRNIDKYKDPDISYISHPGSLIISPRTHDLIAPVVNDVAELLPVSFDNETWYLLNVFNQVSALDKANSQYKIYRSGKVGWLTKVAFLADKVPHNKLFKIPENPARIYFAEHHEDNDESSIKNIIEKNNLFGIKFVKVFES